MYSSMLWSFYIFQLWYQRYIEELWGIEKSKGMPVDFCQDVLKVVNTD